MTSPPPRPTSRRQAVLLVALLLTLGGPAWAQMDGTFTEHEVEVVEEREEAPRESVREALESEERAQVSWFEETVALEEQERMDTAMNRLGDLIDNTSSGSDQRANYMFRLAELYYRRARFFEQRAYERRDRAYEVRSSNPAQSQQYERASEDDLEQSDRSALRAIELYVDIYDNYHASYPGMDGVLYYLGSTLSQLGRLEDALDFFEELANDFPDSPYLPRALLAFGEYNFLIVGDMQQAQIFYQAVSEFPESEVYPYALYQEAWCFYNTMDYPEGLQRLLDAIEASSGESSGRVRMRNRALSDLTLFYVEVGSAENVFSFFESIPEITEEQVLQLVESVAAIYSEDASYDKANTLYRELMARNRDSFRIVRYQREIVRNTIPGAREEEIVREVRRWAELFNTAKTFEDATPEAVAEAADGLEYEVRRLATTYHRDAKVTNSEVLYALSYNLYGDWVELLSEYADTDTAYTMTFYYAELLYRNERYADAAAMWHRSLEIDPQGSYNEEAVYKRVLALTRLVDMEGEMEVPHTVVSTDPTDSTESVGAPVPLELPVVMAELVEAADAYVLLDPDPEFAVEVEFAAARILYEYAHLREAVGRFGRIATTYATVDPERARVSAELLLDSLGALNDTEGMETWVVQLRQTDLNRGQFAVRLGQLGTQIGFSNCRNIQTAGRYEECGLCYFDFFREYHDSDLVDRALFNSALCFESANKIAESIRVREYLIQYRPESSLVPEIRYNLGQMFHRLALYRDAAVYYEEYAQEHADTEEAPVALGNAAQFRYGLGEYDEAIAAYESYIDLFEDRPEDVALAFFQIGAIYEDRGQDRDAVRQFREYLDEYAGDGPPGLAIEAATRIGRLTWEDNPEQAEGWFVQALDEYNGLSETDRAELDAQSLDAAAEARFMLGEYVYQEFTQIEIQGSEAQVQESLRRKLEIGQQAGQVYQQVRAFNRAGWSIAAFTRLGQLYHEFYESVINAPVPDGMEWQVEEQYRAMLVEQSEAVKLQAIDSYLIALDIARTAGWFNEYSAQAEQNLARLDPSFRAGNEVRAAPRFDSATFYAIGFLESLEEEAAEPAEPAGPVENEEPETPDTGPPGESDAVSEAAP